MGEELLNKDKKETFDFDSQTENSTEESKKKLLE